MKYTSELACVNYSIMSAEVRRLTSIIRRNPCEEPSDRDGTCIDEHWTIETTQQGREMPSRAFEDMCDKCQMRLNAIKERRAYRVKFGAAKRIVESVGKRLRKEADGK